MNFMKDILKEANTFYHVTPISNYPSIKEKGLIPQIGLRSEVIDDEKGVYLFPNYEDCENALFNWLGEEYEELEEELITLKVRLPLDFPLVETCEWERMSLITIPPDYISFFKNEG